MSGPTAQREPRPPDSPGLGRLAWDLFSVAAVFSIISIVTLVGGFGIYMQIRSTNQSSPPTIVSPIEPSPDGDPARGGPPRGVTGYGVAPSERGGGTSKGPPRSTSKPSDTDEGQCDPGFLDFNSPEEMTWKESVEVLARVSYQGPTTAPSELPGRGTTKRVSAPACRSMRAELSGPGFSISPEGPSETRIVTEDDPAVWVWSVTPNESGPRTLYLNLYTVGPEGDTGKKLHEQPIDVIVPVADRASNFIKDWLAPLGIGVTAIATGTGAARAWWKRIRRKRKPLSAAPWDRQAHRL